MQKAEVSETLESDFCMLSTCIIPAGYVPDATEKDKILEQTVRDLSICIRNSLVLNKTPAFTARDIVLRRCGQTDPIPFKKCYPDS